MKIPDFKTLKGCILKTEYRIMAIWFNGKRIRATVTKRKMKMLSLEV